MSGRVVVVGAGLAGWTTAVAATEAGADVTVLEKTPQVGGSSVLSGGFLALAGTPQQEARGLVDDPETLRDDLLAVGGHRSDPGLVGSYAAGQPELVDWLTEHRVEILDVEHSAGQSVARSHRTDPRVLVSTLQAQALAAGAQLRLDSPVSTLVREGGAVTGVRIGDERVTAETVVLATGGFSRSEDLLARYAPSQVRALRLGGAGCTGDGLRLGLQVGAGLRDMEQVKGTFGTHPDAGRDRDELLLAFYLGAVVVNRSARRFVDESLSYKLLGDACLAEDGSVAFQVFDQQVFDSAPAGVALFDPRPLLERGLLLTHDSWEGLADQMAVPAEALAETMAAYDHHLRDGGPLDPPRSGLVNGAGSPPTLTHPPYYAYPSTSVVLATYCGLAVDARTRVLDAEGEAIPGLLAVGEVTGGFHGAAYMTGSSLGKALHFGLVAGREAAGRPTGAMVP